MFRLSSDTVKKIILKEIDYNSLPYDGDNEVNKGFHFEDQARVNLNLQGNHTPICMALETECKKSSCDFYANKSGKIKNGWICREYQVDFPSALFDSRHHTPFIGDDEIDKGETIKNFKKFEQLGAKYVCLQCKTPYQNKPKQPYKNGHGGRMLEMCGCGSGLFDDIDSFLINMEKEVSG
jgi:hypothetical protein